MKSSILFSVTLAVCGLVISLQSCANNTNRLSAQIGSTQTPKVERPSPTPENPLSQFDLKKAEQLTDTAKFLAGMEVKDTSAIAKFTQNNVWRNHAASFQKDWDKLEAQQLSKVRQWSHKKLASKEQPAQPIFYPFSGPDFLYAHSFFPNSSEYVLIGLEPVGEILSLENLSTSQANSKLQNITGSMNAILGFSFFRTNSMKVDLAKQGVLPILYVFLARTNNRILEVQPINLDRDANIQKKNKSNPSQNTIPGVKISFVGAEKKQPQTLYYFSTDLSNTGFNKTPQINQFIAKLDKPLTYLKAASYLMHDEHFSKIRNLILSQSTDLLQDDSGIPLKHFDQQQWALNFYGAYTKPIDLFSGRYQPELRKAYNSDRKPEPLNFGIGYKFRLNQSNLMLATRKNQPDSQP
jgi:hypothetical protein